MPRKRIGKLPPGDRLTRRLIRVPQSMVDWANDHGGLAYVTRELIGIQMRLETAGKTGWLPKQEPEAPPRTREQVLEIVREQQRARREALLGVVATYEMMGEEIPGYTKLQSMMKRSGFECSRSVIRLDLQALGKKKAPS
jgi:hypothetical protein